MHKHTQIITHAYTHISHFLFQREEQPHTCTNTQCSGYFAATRIEAELSLRTFKDAKSKTMCLAGDCGKNQRLNIYLKKQDLFTIKAVSVTKYLSVYLG